MATRPGKIVRIEIPRGTYAVRGKLFVRNAKAVKLKGVVRRGSP